MRLLSYNVRSLRDDRAALTGTIRAAAPDVVCVQEAPRFFRSAPKCAALARESGLYVVTGGRSAAAMLILSALRVRVLATRDVRLSPSPRLHRRGLAVAVVEVDGARWTVASMHLGLDPAERLRHAREVLDVLSAYDDPLVLAGDVNEHPGGPAWSLLAERLRDCGGGPTFPARAPKRRIDAVFADPRLECVSCDVPLLPGLDRASDHLPLLADLRARQA